jgi:hypothetical protein
MSIVLQVFSTQKTPFSIEMINNSIHCESLVQCVSRSIFISLFISQHKDQTVVPHKSSQTKVVR